MLNTPLYLDGGQELHNLVDGDHNDRNIVEQDGDVAHAAVAAGDTFVVVADRVDHVSFAGFGGASHPNHFDQAPTFLPV